MATIRATPGTVTVGSRTNTTIPAPAGIQDGDILLALLDVGGSTSPAVTPPSGFTEITTTGWPLTYARADPWQVKVHAYWKVASSESGNYTFTHSSASTEAIMFAISGADTTTPVSPTSTHYETNLGNTQNTMVAPGLTTPRDSSVVVGAWSNWNGMNTTPPTGTTPTFTEYFDGGAGGVFYVCGGTLATAGATGDKTLSIGGKGW